MLKIRCGNTPKGHGFTKFGSMLCAPHSLPPHSKNFAYAPDTFIQLYWFVSNNKQSFIDRFLVFVPPITTSVGEVETPLIIVLA